MDIFKQKKYLLVTVAILIILNLAILTMMWFNKPAYIKPPEHNKARPNEQEQISSLLKQELSFNDEQVHQYLELRRVNSDKMNSLQNEIRDIKGQMFDDAISENMDPEISDSLLSIMLEKQGQIEKLTYQHLVDLKDLCNTEQQVQLQSLLHRLLPPPDRKEGPPSGEKENRLPPPGEFEDRPPRPPV